MHDDFPTVEEENGGHMIVVLPMDTVNIMEGAGKQRRSIE